MSQHPSPFEPTNDPLREADELIDKADALLRRRGGERETLLSENAATEIPVLTEVVNEFDVMLPPIDADLLAPTPKSKTKGAPAAQLGDSSESIELVEYMISIDTEIAREIEAWFASELPQLVSRELERMSERLREEVMAHVRATLLPTLSEHLSERLSQIPSIKR